jgi:uncharacterized membrane-anchored protein YitT (DUF2179 family)
MTFLKESRRTAFHTGRAMSMPWSSAAARAPARHTLFDDLQAGATAIVLMSLGLALLNGAGLVAGGAPGLAFLLSYSTGLPLGGALFVVNLPFYALAWREMGGRFTLKTLAAVSGLSVGVEIVRQTVTLHAAPAYAALAGGMLIGVGLLVMFRHRASFGGINILALYLNKRFGWSAGKVQLAVDIGVLAAALLVIDGLRVAWSGVAAVAVNAVLIWNHRPGRYLPDSDSARASAAASSSRVQGLRSNSHGNG